MKKKDIINISLMSICEQATNAINRFGYIRQLHLRTSNANLIVQGVHIFLQGTNCVQTVLLCIM